LTLSIKDEKELPFSFASSKDLEKEISFSSMIFRCEVFCCTLPADVNCFAALLELPSKISGLPKRPPPLS
jgi:hypothetical protein